MRGGRGGGGGQCVTLEEPCLVTKTESWATNVGEERVSRRPEVTQENLGGSAEEGLSAQQKRQGGEKLP